MTRFLSPFSLKPAGWSAPLTACDCYIVALDDTMQRLGQGRHVGVTMLEVGPGFSSSLLRETALRFAAIHPLLGAELKNSCLGALPRWSMGKPVSIEVVEHPREKDPLELAQSLLVGDWSGMLRFDLVEGQERTTILMSWSHLILDGRGVELVLAEVARMAVTSGSDSPLQSWGTPVSRPAGLFNQLKASRVFRERYEEIRKERVRSLGEVTQRGGPLRVRLMRFSAAESESINKRSQQLTGGILVLPYFLAIAMRAHALILEKRGVREGALECAVSVQKRKRGASKPIFQNQLTQLFFSLHLMEITSLEITTHSLQEQFTAMTKSGCDESFLIMANWMRRLPLALYRSFLKREASGQVASFYHAYTGAFMPGLHAFCGGTLVDGWHLPSIAHPPGTGLFCSEHAGKFTAALCWRDGVLSPDEAEHMERSIRNDLLGTDI